MHTVNIDKEHANKSAIQIGGNVNGKKNEVKYEFRTGNNEIGTIRPRAFAPIYGRTLHQRAGIPLQPDYGK
jgi:hypothetical protein